MKWGQLCSGPSFTQRWKDFGTKTYLFTACANCYLRFWGKVIFKTENIPSITWSWLNAFARFECDNSAIDVIINFLWKLFHKPIGFVVQKFSLARQKIHWLRAIGPLLISNTVTPTPKMSVHSEWVSLIYFVDFRRLCKELWEEISPRNWKI